MSTAWWSRFCWSERSLATFFLVSLMLEEKSILSSSSMIVLRPPNISRWDTKPPPGRLAVRVVVWERLLVLADLKLDQSRSNSSSFSREPLNLISKSLTSYSPLVWLLLAIISLTLLPPREWDLFYWLVSRIWSRTWFVFSARSLLFALVSLY